MAQRSELFSVRNIIFLGLILTIVYGTYSYNSVRNRLKVSHENFLSMRSEVTQGSNRLKAAIKARMSCMKDLKQMRTTMWELRSKMSDLETESNKQKHDVESKFVSLRKESDSWKSQYEDIQKELLKLKEDDRVKLAKNREETEESEKKLRKLVAENEMALTKLKDNLQDVKSENERLKVALAGAKRQIGKSDDSSAPAKPKHSEGGEPLRQVRPPGNEKSADTKIGVSPTSSKAESITHDKTESKSLNPTTTKAGSKTVDKTVTHVLNTIMDKAESKNLDKTDSKTISKTKSRTSTTENEAAKADSEPATNEKAVPIAMEGQKSKKDTKVESKNEADKDAAKSKSDTPAGKDSKQLKAESMEGKNKAADDLTKSKDLSNLVPEKSAELQSLKINKDSAKSLKFGEQNGNAEDSPSNKEAENKGNVGEKNIRKESQRRNFQAALDKIRQSKDAAGREEAPQQQVDMPIPHAAVRRNREPNQLPQPVQPAAAEKKEEKPPVKPQGGAQDEDDHLL